MDANLNRCVYLITRGESQSLYCGVHITQYNSDLSPRNQLCKVHYPPMKHHKQLPEDTILLDSQFRPSDRQIYLDNRAVIRRQINENQLSLSEGFNVKCPICRTSNYISNNIKKVKGLDIKCCICDDNNADIHFNECSHINSCHECVTKMKI